MLSIFYVYPLLLTIIAWRFQVEFIPDLLLAVFRISGVVEGYYPFHIDYHNTFRCYICFKQFLSSMFLYQQISLSEKWVYAIYLYFKNLFRFLFRSFTSGDRSISLHLPLRLHLHHKHFPASVFLLHLPF